MRALREVALDRVRVSHLRVFGIGPGVAQRAPLAKQIPAPVEFDLHGAQPLLVFTELVHIAAVCLFAAAKVVFLGDEVFDSRRDAFVAHAHMLSVRAGYGEEHDRSARAATLESSDRLDVWLARTAPLGSFGDSRRPRPRS